MTNKEKNSHQELLFLAFWTNTNEDTLIFNLQSCVRKFLDTTSCPIPCYSNNLKKSYCYNNPASVRITGLLLPTVYYATNVLLLWFQKEKIHGKMQQVKLQKSYLNSRKKWAQRQNKSSALCQREQLLLLAGILKDCSRMNLFPVLNWSFNATLCLYRQLNCCMNRWGYWKLVCAGVWFPCDKVKQWPYQTRQDVLSACESLSFILAWC